MLVLARKINQSIIIQDDVEIMILDIQGEQVKLGIKAPERIKIYRKEIYDEIQKENIRAAKSELPKDLDSLIDKRSSTKI